MQRHFRRHQWHRSLKLHVRRTLWQNHSHIHSLIRDALTHLRPFEKRHLQDISLAGLEFPQNVLEVAIPPNAKAVFPAAKDGIPRLEFEIGFLGIAPEAAGTDVADVVREVRIEAPNLEGHAERFDRAGRRAVVLLVRGRPGHAGELALEVCAFVREPIALFGREVAAPLANFEVSLEERGIDQGLGEFVARTGLLLYTSRSVFVRAVGESGTLTLGGKGVVRDINGRKFDFCLLLAGWIAGGGVSGEGAFEVLFLVLFNESGERGEGRKYVVAY